MLAGPEPAIYIFYAFMDIIFIFTTAEQIYSFGGNPRNTVLNQHIEAIIETAARLFTCGKFVLFKQITD